jgi:hypothetical protein
MKDSYYNLPSVVADLIEYNEKNRYVYDPSTNNSGDIMFARECYTVSINPGCASGKTYTINSLATDDDVIIGICGLSMQKKLYPNKKNVFTVNDIFEGRLRGIKFNRVYIDDADYVFRKYDWVDVFYKIFADHQIHTVVLMG